MGEAPTYYYRPQRSCCNVMFLHLSIILFTGVGVFASVMHGYTPPSSYPPLGRYTPPWAGTPRHIHPSGQVHPQAGTPLGRYPPDNYTPRQGTPPSMVTAVDGKHPAGMLSCLLIFLSKMNEILSRGKFA